MKKIFDKKTIFTILITMIICLGGIVVASTIYKATDISYTSTDSSWNVSNVSDAINSLYDMNAELDNIKSLGDATADDIIKGKTAVVNGKLITGNFIVNSDYKIHHEITDYENYQQTKTVLTINKSGVGSILISAINTSGSGKIYAMNIYKNGTLIYNVTGDVSRRTYNPISNAETGIVFTEGDVYTCYLQCGSNSGTPKVEAFVYYWE